MRFYYSSLRFVTLHGRPLPPFDGKTPTLLLASHRNGAADGWIFNQLLPTAQFLTSVQLHRSRFLRLMFAGIPVVRDKDRVRYFIEEVIRLARIYTYLDDLEHYQTTRLTLPFRKGIKEIGERLVALGVLREASDIYFAPFSVLDDAIREERFDTLEQVVYANQAGWRQAKQRSPAWNYDEQSSAEDTPTGNELTGLAGSPGTVEGEVFLIHSPDDFALFPKGAILVARTTNPAWTSLFYRASGVITESGGPLSHGAVTARELQLPAVMSVRGVMTRLQNGMRVRLDGKRHGQRVVTGAARRYAKPFATHRSLIRQRVKMVAAGGALPAARRRP